MLCSLHEIASGKMLNFAGNSKNKPDILMGTETSTFDFTDEDDDDDFAYFYPTFQKFNQPSKNPAVQRQEKDSGPLENSTVQRPGKSSSIVNR